MHEMNNMDDSKRILVIEPVPTDAELIELQIRKSGVPLTVKRIATKDLIEGMLAEFLPDLIVVDNAVPRCDVPALIRKGREEHPEARWVVVSGPGSEEIAVESMKAGASDYVAKKSINRLGSIVKAILEAPPPPPAISAEQEPAPPLPAPSGENELFRQVIESLSDYVAVTDLNGKRLYNSPSYQALLEEPDTLEGTSSFLDIHPEDRERVREAFKETIATGVGQRLEYRLIDRDGNIRFIESQGSIINDDAGRPGKIVVLSRDITTRRRTGEIMRMVQEEIALLREENFFPGVVRSLGTALGIKYALVSECVDRRCERVRALAYWAQGDLAPVFEYDLKGTVCERVFRTGEAQYFPSDVKDRFPEEEALAAMNAYAYMGVPLLDAEGFPIGHMFIIHDEPLPNEDLAASVLAAVAARAASELDHRMTVRRLMEEEGESRSFLEELAEGVIAIDLEDVIVYVNPAMAALSGYAVDDMVGKLSSTLLFPGDERGEVYARNEKWLNGLTDEYEASLQRKDGSRFSAHFSTAPHKNRQGEVLGALTIVTTAAARVPVQARDPEEAAMLGEMPDAVFVCDPEGKIMFWNRGAAHLYGWSADEARGRESDELLQTEGTMKGGEAVRTAVIEGSWAGELQQRRKDGGIVVVDARWTLMRDPDGHPKSVLVIATNITGKKEVEIFEIRARRLEGIAALVGAVAADLHDIMTPMTLTIPSLAPKADDEASRQAVSLIAGNAQSGIDLANQILALVDLSPEGDGQLDPAALIAATAKSVSASLPTDVSIETPPPRKLWPVTGILPQLQQVLTNVCTNAWESMPRGGVLRLAAENVSLDAQEVASHPPATAGRYVMISVSDTGRGIPPEILEKVFEPFFTTKPPGRTTGLGLSTAAAIVRNQKGFMDIFSEPGKGTIVKLYLPAGELTSRKHESNLTMVHGERVLVAHQQASMREILRKLLDTHGFDVLSAADGAEAIALFRRYRNEIHAAIIDLRMQFMDAPTTIRVLQGMNPELKIIAVGGPDDNNLPGCTLLQKPFTISSLLGALSSKKPAE
jgi:hypothetical protein